MRNTRGTKVSETDAKPESYASRIDKEEGGTTKPECRNRKQRMGVKKEKG